MGQTEERRVANGGRKRGFHVLPTTDKNIRYQQDLTRRKIAVVVLGRQQWPQLRPRVHLIVGAVNAATPGS
jgi:hypothetical protein